MATPPQTGVDAPTERRFYSRIAPSALIYLPCGENNDGILLNVSENGLLVSTPQQLRCNFVSRVSIHLNGLPKAFQVHVRVVWTNDAQKRAGMQLIDLTEHDREQIRKWGTLETSKQAEKERLLPTPEVTKNADSDVAVTSPGHNIGTVGAIPVGVGHRMADDRGVAEGMSSPPHRPPKPKAPARPVVRRTAARKNASTLIWMGVPIVIGMIAVLLLKSGLLPNPLLGSVDPRERTVPAAPIAATGSPNDPNSAVHARGATRASGDRRSSTERDTGSEDDVSSLRFDENHPIPRTPRDEDAQADPEPPLAATIPAIVTQPLPASEASSGYSDKRGVAATEPPGKSANGSATNNLLPNNHSQAEPMSNPVLVSSQAPDPAGGRAAFLARRSGSNVSADGLETDVMDVRPESHSASFLLLPGERLLESASVTMRIQRSVLMPGERKWWPFHRNKRVALGALISHVDPPGSQLPFGSPTTVTVRAYVSREGEIESVQPVSGPPALVPDVVRAVREWRYQPTLVDNKPVVTYALVEFQFHTAARVAGP
jgi:PilZ domain/Gram-negative bacterial TonB protein C-terminal